MLEEVSKMLDVSQNTGLPCGGCFKGHHISKIELPAPKPRGVLTYFMPSNIAMQDYVFTGSERLLWRPGPSSKFNSLPSNQLGCCTTMIKYASEMELTPRGSRKRFLGP